MQSRLAVECCTFTAIEATTHASRLSRHFSAASRCTVGSRSRTIGILARRPSQGKRFLLPRCRLFRLSDPGQNAGLCVGWAVPSAICFGVKMSVPLFKSSELENERV